MEKTKIITEELGFLPIDFSNNINFEYHFGNEIPRILCKILNENPYYNYVHHCFSARYEDYGFHVQISVILSL